MFYTTIIVLMFKVILQATYWTNCFLTKLCPMIYNCINNLQTECHIQSSPTCHAALGTNCHASFRTELKIIFKKQNGCSFDKCNSYWPEYLSEKGEKSNITTIMGHTMTHAAFTVRQHLNLMCYTSCGRPWACVCVRERESLMVNGK